MPGPSRAKRYCLLEPRFVDADMEEGCFVFSSSFEKLVRIIPRDELAADELLVSAKLRTRSEINPSPRAMRCERGVIFSGT